VPIVKVAWFDDRQTCKIVHDYKETWFERKQRLEETIVGLRLEQSFVQAEVDVEVTSDDAVAALQAFADEIDDVMAAAEESLDLRRAIVERLKITGSIAVEDGVKVLRLVCFLGEGTLPSPR
jgi:hypothetical protein